MNYPFKSMNKKQSLLTIISCLILTSLFSISLTIISYVPFVESKFYLSMTEGLIGLGSLIVIFILLLPNFCDSLGDK